MPKSQLDWLGIASLWLGSALMAIKAANLPLLTGAPIWLTANWLNYVPLALITFYLTLVIYRQVRKDGPSPSTAATESLDVVKDVPPAAEISVSKQDLIGSMLAAEGKRRKEVIASVKLLERNIAISRADTIGRATENYAPKVRAALLTLEKEFNLKIPPESGISRSDIFDGRQFINLVVPFLEQGHVDEARKRAEKFVSFSDG